MKEISKQEIREELERFEDDFDYDGEFCSINAVRQGRNHAVVKHFLVQRDKRGNGYGSTLFKTLLEVLRENGIDTVTVEIQALEDGGPSDPIVSFFEDFGFDYLETFEHHNWGTCIRLRGYTY